MLSRNLLVAGFPLVCLTADVAAAVIGNGAASDSTTVASKCTAARAAATPQDTITYAEALAKASRSVQTVAEMVEGAEANSKDRIKIDWGGNNGITCNLGFREKMNSWIQQPIDQYALLTDKIDLSYMYTEHENIACIASSLPSAPGTCMYLEDTLRPLSGLEVVVLFNALHNQQCSSVGQVPVRLIEKDNFNDFRDGKLIIKTTKGSKGCEGVCDTHSSDLSEHLGDDCGE